MLVGDFLGYLDRLAPFSLALDWDNSGLQVGDPKAKAQKVALALDPTNRVIDQAIERRADLLITHHPLIFKPSKSLNLQNPLTSPIFKAIKGELSIISAHTNWDKVGVAQALAERLELIPDGPLELDSEELAKLTVFAPAEGLDSIKQALFQVGVGRQGNYVETAYALKGVGQFRPEPGSQPYVGDIGELTKVDEIRLETILPKSLIPAATLALRSTHPYEEPAFDFTICQRPEQGLGLLAHWPTPRDPLAFCVEKLGLNKANLEPSSLDQLRFAGPEPGPISQVALLPGSGGDYLLSAQKAGAQILITGEMSHHHALLAEEANFCVLAAGHYETESPGLLRLGQELEKITRRLGATIEYIYLSEHSPWRKPGR
ncbi:MAG: Nif3-like dinuclear metal center hexameric protein [Deltaproteobacteria bacterium]|jgi:dinuclear metal center YbgI/SA1388 family protein|nr:Nif3-like dinuclear metal center hexameric protein [Deltaproteobacteria bacterium]